MREHHSLLAMELSGKSVLITGGANGIGAALAEALASRGCRLTLADVDASAGEATAARLRAAGAACVFVRCDVTDAAQQAAAFAAHVRAHGGLDVAVLNAGIEENPSFLDSDEAQLRRVLDINVRDLSSEFSSTPFSLTLVSLQLRVPSVHGRCDRRAARGGALA